MVGMEIGGGRIVQVYNYITVHLELMVISPGCSSSGSIHISGPSPHSVLCALSGVGPHSEDVHMWLWYDCETARGNTYHSYQQRLNWSRSCT